MMIGRDFFSHTALLHIHWLFFKYHSRKGTLIAIKYRLSANICIFTHG